MKLLPDSSMTNCLHEYLGAPQVAISRLQIAIRIPQVIDLNRKSGFASSPRPALRLLYLLMTIFLFSFCFRVIDAINQRTINISIQRIKIMNLNPQILQDEHIEKLFSHPLFQQKLLATYHSFSHIERHSTSNIQIVDLVQDITALMIGEIQSLHNRSYIQMKDQIQKVQTELHQLKNHHYLQNTKIDSSMKSSYEECLFEDQPFELSQIKRNIQHLQQKVREINMNSSCILDNSSIFKQQHIVREDLIQQTIDKEIGKLELSFSQQQETLEDIFNKKIQKVQKTINNILQTLNQLHPIAVKPVFQAKTLANCKSAGKLKSFFGFN